MNDTADTVQVYCERCYHIEQVPRIYVSQNPLEKRFYLPTLCPHCRASTLRCKVNHEQPLEKEQPIANFSESQDGKTSCFSQGAGSHRTKRKLSCSMHSQQHQHHQQHMEDEFEEDMSSSHTHFDYEDSLSSRNDELLVASRHANYVDMLVSSSHSRRSSSSSSMLRLHNLSPSSSRLSGTEDVEMGSLTASFTAASLVDLPLSPAGRKFSEDAMNYSEESASSARLQDDDSMNLTVDAPSSSLDSQQTYEQLREFGELGELVLSLRSDRKITNLELDGKLIKGCQSGSIGLLANAIQGNKSVRSVKIDGHFLENISAENQEQIFGAVGSLPSLKSLDVIGVGDAWLDLPVPALTLALRQATGLEELRLEDYTLTGSDEVQQGFFNALKGLKSLTNFKLVDLIPPEPTNLDGVIRALSCLKKLEDIHINYNEAIQAAGASPPAVSVESVGRLSKDREFCKMLKKLVLTNVQIGQEHVTMFADGLNKNKTLQFVDLSYNRLGDAAGVAIANALKTNKTLETLHLEGVHLGKAAGQKLAQALKVNKTLQVLSLKHNDLGDDDSIVAIADALKSNSTLKNLRIVGVSSHRLSRRASVALLDMLRVNYTLQRLITDVQGEIHLQILYYLKLNRAGRRQLLRSSHSSPNSPSIINRNWVDALVQTQGDLSCTYYFMRKNPALVKEGLIGL